ncbi:MAG: EF-P lysine aminoacylase GenX [Chloroflexi bacterium]|nr:EF-P lysine aminoacylase GenX [Chloroflexota bacterium]
MESERERLARIKPHLERRALVYEATRHFFRERGFLEIETPIRMPTLAPEAQITPIESDGWFLSTSPELHMKRLLAAGYDRLFQIGRCFRKGERGRWHNPEFTLLEWYRTGADYLQMIGDTEDLVCAATTRLGLGSTIRYQGERIDLSPPWSRVTVRQAFLGIAGWDPVREPDPVRFDTDLVTKVIPGFAPDHPVVLLDYPAPMASLARLNPNDPAVAERAEVFIGGLELANAFSELTDARTQKERFAEEMEAIKKGGRQHAPMPERFLGAMGHFPECGGIALGMDRLVMLLCDARSIDEVMPFTVDTI